MRTTIRPLARNDHATVQAVFDGMSAASRLRRFHGPVHALTPRLLTHLADVDGHDHLAVVATVGRGRRARPVGLARLVRTAPHEAEFAVEVVDAAQGRGIGRRLVAWARQAAPEHGIDLIVAEVLVDNAPMRRLLGSAFPGASTSSDGHAVTYRCRVGDASWNFDAAELVGARA